MYKILLLTDFSLASRHAIAYAQALFSDTSVDFCLLHTFPLVPVEGYSGSLLLGEQIESAEKSIKSLKHAIKQQEPTYHTYRSQVALGTPAHAVEVILTQQYFDLVVLGATGLGKNELFGSVATGMIRQAKTNVLTVPVSAPIQPVKRIVLAIDYTSINDAESLHLLSDIANRKAALVTLLSIENPNIRKMQGTETSRQYVLGALANVSTEIDCVHEEDVRYGIKNYLKEHSVDLLVMLPHHKGFLDVVTQKSVSRSVAFQPKVPLLTLYDEKIKGASSENKPDIDEIPFNTYL
ncbi:universal stress protein [Spirosoma aureum]|uniref:Universal stress protein n=1 Tax=Spirosoma aureum TaxID=2692134 RepID=A0A6G9AMT8_9BACT|nr:universal stress protein [Spirosoma aureum]QIP13720.1 universal stress protein [Spirosoma aureum]